MRLATLRDKTRDGRLHVVAPDGATGVASDARWPTMQRALDDWQTAEAVLRAQAEALAAGKASAIPLDPAQLASPLPRAYEWVDGSAYLNHVILARRARGAEPHPELRTEPLFYQGGSSEFLGPCDNKLLVNPAWGLDFEAEVAVVLGDVPQGMRAADAPGAIRLIMLVNDWTLRNLVPGELAKGFGFFRSKPATAFSPFAVTPDELGDAWQNGRAHLRVQTTLRGDVVGDVDAGPEMHFSFYELIEYIAMTRGFCAGTILGSGTVSNEDRARGVSCLAERRAIEMIETGAAKTPFLTAGDRVTIRAWPSSNVDSAHQPAGLFGAICQTVVAP